MKILNVCLFILLLFIGYAALNGPNGFKERERIESQIISAKQKTQKLMYRNELMTRNIANLVDVSDLSLVEDLARTNLGMVKEDESFYRIIKDDEK